MVLFDHYLLFATRYSLIVVTHALAKNRFKRPPRWAAANIRRELGQEKKGVHRPTAGLRLAAIMLRHKHSNSRGKGNAHAFCAINGANEWLIGTLLPVNIVQFSSARRKATVRKALVTEKR